MPAAGRAATQQFAAFRLALLDVEDGRPVEAAAWRDWLATTYPGAPISVAAAALVDDATAGLPLATACARVTLFLQGEPRPTGVLDGEVGYGNPDLGAADVCTVGRSGRRTAAPQSRSMTRRPPSASPPLMPPLPLPWPLTRRRCRRRWSSIPTAAWSPAWGRCSAPPEKWRAPRSPALWSAAATAPSNGTRRGSALSWRMRPRRPAAWWAWP